MSAKNLKSRGLLTRAQIKGWEREYSALGKQAAKIEARRTTIKTLLDAAQMLATHEDDAQPLAPRPRRQVRRRKRTLANKVIATQPSASGDSVRKGGRKSVWGTFITNYTLEADRAVPYSELKQEIMKTPLGPKLEQSDKGFYHAISRLDKHKVIKAYRGHTFSPEAFGRFQADLAAGKVRDIKIPNSAHYSPMGVAIEALMKTRPNGAESGHIIWELRKNPEFAATIDKNHTHPYNVLARMVRQQQLIKRGKRYFSPKTETPSGSSEGVSNLFGDGGTSPNRDRGAA